MIIGDSTLPKDITREAYLTKAFGIELAKPKRTNIEGFSIRDYENPSSRVEYMKIPLDLPWKELEKDVELAFSQFGWWGMINRSKQLKYNDNDRSPIYGGLGLTYNPNMDDNPHSHGLGSKVERVDGHDTYSDHLGLNRRTDVTYFRSFKYVFDLFKPFTLIQGRLAQIRTRNGIGLPHLRGGAKPQMYHVDECCQSTTRILIPLVYDENYWIEFYETGNRIDFEPGYGYFINVELMHRWNYKYTEDPINRTAIVAGFSPWLEFNDGNWTANEYTNVMHPVDMIRAGKVL